MTSSNGYDEPAVAGSGTIACGLATSASVLGEVWLLARSDASASRAEEAVEKAAANHKGASAERIRVTNEPKKLADCDLVVEAIAEDADAKGELLASLAQAAPDADLASTTSSLSIADLGDRAKAPDRVFGLHVFNPVPRMELIELCVPDSARDGLAERAHAWCSALGKTPIEVPDSTGFVVNRLLFPYLFDAVRFMEESGMTPAAVDDCMSLGAGHPMGPLKLLDFVGLDVAVAIGESLGDLVGDEAHSAPALIAEMVADGKLGRKSGEGFYKY
ncbi:MAG TPA: 3-hydroxyacyl-CoA dehydrogenase family protein [Solirubrobacterales bacterium]|nr:3-hydroxyacyl-CoA dehydrogenase family protein [Solirubrobacterales bacterium]